MPARCATARPTFRCPALNRLCEPLVTSRVLVIAAHPDDETIGAGALLARSIDAHVAIVTDGVPRDRTLWPATMQQGTREDYARTRRDELHAALAAIGIAADRVKLLNFPDNEAIDALPAIVQALAELLDTLNPDIVLTHAYEGAHVDHDTTALAVHAAMSLTGRDHPHEMALYHASGDEIVVHEFLQDEPAPRAMPLNERLRRRKTRMIECYGSQHAQHGSYFTLDVERFRCAGSYDFSRLPSPGLPVLYERKAASVSGKQWRERAAHALRDLNIELAGNRVRLAAEASEDAPPAALVSIIIRSMGRDTLCESLESIASQTYPNIEVVVVDAAGTDAEAPCAAHHVRSRHVTFGHPLMRARAANVGLDQSTGQYIAFLDDDDWLHPEHIGRLVAALGDAKASRAAYGDVEVVGWPDESAPVKVGTFDSPYDPIALLCENYIPIHAALFDRSLLEEGEGCRFDEMLEFFEDWDFWIQLSRRTTFTHVPGLGAVYRWPPSSQVNDSRRTAAAQSHIFRKWHHAFSPDDHVTLLQRLQARQRTIEDNERVMGALRRDMGAQVAELEQTRAVAEERVAELARTRLSLTSLGEELDRERHRVAERAASITDLRARMEEHDRHLAEILASRSWRWTAPLRAGLATLIAVRRWLLSGGRR